MDYEAAIGLEIHVELKTQTKMFCDSPNDPDERRPNVNVCPICLGHPGTLPVANRAAVAKLIQVGLALHGEVQESAVFERKNYFYPDLPKGYQISQYQHPLVKGGYLEINLPNASRIDSNDSRIVLKEESYRLMRLLFEVHNKLGPIYKEKNYCDAIEEVLKREGIPYERERKIVLKFENLEVSNFFVDFVVDNKILLEVKAKPFITKDDLRQASRYINTLGIPLAIVVNFKRQKLESKRIINPAFENHSSSFGKDSRKIRIQRIHLEEDTGRLIHDPETKTTLVDFNRAGIPLMELVTEPDLRSGEAVRQFGEELQKILRYLHASDADMEKGQMRVEVNVSLSPIGSGTLGTKVELKNINSFRFAADAVDYEIGRQAMLLRRGEAVRQETRGWDAAKGITVSQRVKEESEDYRYFPEPDLPPLRIEPSWMEELRRSPPELPAAKRRRFREEYRIGPELAETIIRDRHLAAFFEAAISELKVWVAEEREVSFPQALGLAANYLTTDIGRLAGEAKTPLQDSRLTPENFAELMSYLAAGRISSRTAKEVLAEMFRNGADPSVLIEERGLWQTAAGDELGRAVAAALAANPKAAADYRGGKAAALQFLVGRVMKEVPRADPEAVRALMEEQLE